MKKEQCRRRRKREHARRRRGVQKGAAALAAGATIAAGTQAYAGPIRFENTAAFVWTAASGHDVLDVTLSSAVQPGVAGTPSAFVRTGDAYAQMVYRSTPGSRVQGTLLGGYGFLVGVNGGDAIPTAGTTPFGAAYIHTNYYYAYYYAGVRTLLPEGQVTYLGVSFDPGDGVHYGWIGVVRTGQEVDAFAWGYETDPGVPIAAGVPEPGTLALLAFGAAGLAVTRRRRGSAR